MLWDSLGGTEKRNGGWNLLCMPQKPGMRHRTRSSKAKTSQGDALPYPIPKNCWVEEDAGALQTFRSIRLFQIRIHLVEK